MSSSKSSNLLLVEDDPLEQNLALRGLRKAGVSSAVTVASDGQEAIDQIESMNPKDYALVLLDLKLPKVSGHDVLSFIRSKYSLTELPVIIFTSSAEPYDVHRCSAAGVTDYIQKPIDFDEYVATINTIARSWLN